MSESWHYKSWKYEPFPRMCVCARTHVQSKKKCSKNDPWCHSGWVEQHIVCWYSSYLTLVQDKSKANVIPAKDSAYIYLAEEWLQFLDNSQLEMSTVFFLFPTDRLLLLKDNVAIFVNMHRSKQKCLMQGISCESRRSLSSDLSSSLPFSVKFSAAQTAQSWMLPNYFLYLAAIAGASIRLICMQSR